MLQRFSSPLLVARPAAAATARSAAHPPVARSATRIALAILLTSCTTEIDVLPPAAPAALTIAATTSMSSARFGHTATELFDGRIAVIGGRNENGVDVAPIELFDPKSGAWSVGPSMITPRFAHAAALLQDGRVLLVAGEAGALTLDSTEIFDPINNTVSDGPRLPSPRTAVTATRLPNGDVVVIGGARGATPIAESLVLRAGGTAFEATGLLAEARAGHIAVPIGDDVLVTGGLAGASPKALAERFDGASGQFTNAGALATARFQHSAVRLASGEVLVHGGFDAANALSSAELWSPTTQTFTPVGNLRTARRNHASVMLPSGNVFVVAGKGTNNLASDSEIFDVATRTFLAGSPLVSRRESVTAAALSAGRAITIGGIASGVALRDVELFDAQTTSISAGLALPVALSRHALAMLPSGELLIVGGTANGTTPLSDARIYNATTNTFRAVGSLASARMGHTATPLQDGRVVILGGTTGAQDLAGAEVFDPQSEQFTSAGALSNARSDHTATLLLTGEILVAGGTSPTFERYHFASRASVASGALPASRIEHGAIRLPSGDVLLVAGLVGGTTSTSVLRFNAADNTFTSAPALLTARRRAAVALLQDGAVHVSGGLGAGGAPLSSAERLVDAWSAAGALATARSEHVAVSSPTGRVVVAGGRAATGFATAVEAFDPIAATFTTLGAISVGRASPRAALLADGRVLLVGGQAGSPVGNVDRIDEIGSSVDRPTVTSVTLGAPDDATTIAGASLVASGARGDWATEATIARVIDNEGAQFDVPIVAATSTSLSARSPRAPPGHHRLFVSTGGPLGGRAVRVEPRPATGAIPIAAPSTLVADGAALALIDVGPVRDALGALVADDTILDVTTSAGALVATDVDSVRPGLQVPTARGRVAVSLRASTTPADVSLAVSSVLGDAQGAASLRFIPGPGTGAIPLASSRAALVADGVSTTTIDVGPVVDAQGNAVVDGSLVSVSATAGTLFGVDADAAAGLQLALTSGRASFTLRAPTSVGQSSITVRSIPGDALGNVVIPFIAGPPVSPIPVGAAPASIPADGTSQSTISVGPVLDAQGNVVADGTPFTVTTTNGTLVGVDQLTTTQGRFAFALRAPLLSGSATVDVAAQDVAATGVAQIAFTPAPPSGTIAVSVDPASVQAGAAAVSVTAGPLTNTAGTPLEDGALFTLTTTAGNVIAADVDATTPGIQRPSSGARIVFGVDGGTLAQSVVVDVVSVIGQSSGSGSFTVVAGPAHHLELRPPASATAGVAAEVIVVVVDAFGNAATSDAPIAFCVEAIGSRGGAPTLGPGASPGAGGGAAGGDGCGSLTQSGSFAVVDTTAEDVSLAIASVGLPGSASPDDTATLRVDAAAADRLVVVVNDPIADACGLAGATIRLLDAFGNVARPPTGLVVRVAANAALGTPRITSTTMVQATTVPAREVLGRIPDGGEAQLTVTLDRDGALDITASAALPSASTPDSVTFVPGALDASTSTLSALADEVQSGAGSAAIEIVPRDACGVRLGGGRTVVASSTFGALDPIVDVGDGSYTTVFRAAAGECPADPAIISATIDGVALTSTASVRARCAASGEPPIIAESANSFAALQRPYVYDDDRRVAATGTPPIRFTLIDGPEGMFVAENTGRVDWLPLVTGSVHVEIAAENPAGVDVYGFDVDVSPDPPPPPVAAILAAPLAGPSPLDVTFDSSSSSASNGAQILVSRWDFGDGSAPAFGEDAAHRFLRPGGYIVRLQIADSLGGTASASTGVAVTTEGLVPPIARIVASAAEGVDALEVALSCDCTAGTSPIAAYVWELGDGTTSTAAALTHAFSPGAHEVRLVVTDGVGLSAQDRRQIVVLEGGALPPQVFAQATPVAGATPLSVSFAADAGDLDGRVVDLRWTFSDGEELVGEAVDRTFETPGVYLATVIAVDDSGLEGRATVEVQVTNGAGTVPPVILSVPILTARVGEPWPYDDDGLPVARGDRPLVWSLGKSVSGELFGVPPGATIDAPTGKIYWTPDAPGVFPVVLAVENPAGLAAQEIEVVVTGDVPVVDPGCACAASSTFNGMLLVMLLAVVWLRRITRS